ncbi:hypothetical protein [Streptomyces sp. NBC_01353]|uniref:hypothetical protein n=1 Tax=Streptomyces sp. NBC_01353 TaxID=2903835 RepID=UPI002E31938D|nr:hypothetical protein [Streptomyces sp. NBC_01353]
MMTSDDHHIPCGTCGCPIGPRPHKGRVPDSSYVDPHDPCHDGQRPLLACSSEHLAHLEEKVRGRPYHEAELWFAKITQVMARHHYGISMADLSLETGLDLHQLEAGALWITQLHHAPRSAARDRGAA